MKISIDVVIPSYRPDEHYLLPMLQLRRPPAAIIRFYLVVDDPAAVIPATILTLVNDTDVILLHHAQNLGASATRNDGIDAGNGDWVLLLDDDVTVAPDLLEVYTAAALSAPGATGFIGLVELPAADTDFTRAIVATGAMDIFDIARRRAHYAWGATANIMISRRAMGSLRFSPQYPAAGGGEDIDLLLRIRESNGGVDYKCLPAAVVRHPWWHGGKPDFRRTFRYGLGNSWLGQLNPRYTYRDFFNTPETLLLCLPVFMLLLFIKPAAIGMLLSFVAGVLVIEVLATAIQAFKRGQVGSIAMLGYVLALRLVYETGMLVGNLQRGRVQGIGERFHDDGRVQPLHFYRLNTRKTVKWVLYPVLLFLLLR
ncbi:glycosyltransferase family 2 protein [Paraflavitalea sp. CAU 1676]|uniref:glycosyltransferase family 2 protein n=1 Tax=Paraflavitalea sp. CAU 1676 TaxID=3032598 RepID=UPI0023DA5615|nr:glycosyltransferase family 2 protein [Paraflavitalea sp. CAU 1676]MDF2190581.1 glycosyltransferase family 2 protein [Paraflavitalea sp. CAU 1676]